MRLPSHPGAPTTSRFKPFAAPCYACADAPHLRSMTTASRIAQARLSAITRRTTSRRTSLRCATGSPQLAARSCTACASGVYKTPRAGQALPLGIRGVCRECTLGYGAAPGLKGCTEMTSTRPGTQLFGSSSGFERFTGAEILIQCAIAKSCPSLASVDPAAGTTWTSSRSAILA
jgi:hypothetical protein